METAKLKKFAQFARRSLLEQVLAKLELVLVENSAARRESVEAIRKLEEAIKSHGKDQVIERVAYTWFNRFCALRFMDVNRYTRIGVVSPAEGQFQPEILMDAKMGHVDEEMVGDKTRQQIFALLDGKTPSRDPQGEAYRLLVVAACNFWNKAMPFLFQRIDDYTELLMPDDLLSGNSILAYTREAMTPDACKDVEVIGWLYQFYISEKKDKVFDGLKKNKKITPENIPAATQLFTPHWIVRYLVENSLGRLWLLNRPDSKLVEQMDYYIRPDTSVASGQGLAASKGENNDRTKLQGSHRLAEGYGNGKDNLQADSGISEGRTLRIDQSASASSGISSIEHSRGASQTREGGIQEFSFDSQRISGRSGDTTAHSSGPELHQPNATSGSTGTAHGGGQNAKQPDQQTSHQPLATSHSASAHEEDFLCIEKPEDIKICDPACGSGHMLTYAFDLLYAIYEEEGVDPAEIPEKILTNNLYGIEIDERAGELAAFALTMKAAQSFKGSKQRRFFNKGVKPNICVLENVHFDGNELKDYMDFVGRDLFTAPLQTTLRQFEEADNFGSLIRPDVTDVDGMLRMLESKNVSGQLFISMTHQKVLQALRQADYLSPKYHVVIANPPYMGSKGMNPQLADWAKKQFSICWDRGNSDLFALFMERNFGLSQKKGLVAMITMQSWMFLSTYERFRDSLIENRALLSMAHLGPRAFDSIGGEVVSTTAFVFTNTGKKCSGVYRRLVSGRSEFEKDSLFKEIKRGQRPDLNFYTWSTDFEKIPGSPFAYWLTQNAFNAFAKFGLFEKAATACQGLATTDNNRFVRIWPEVSISSVGFGFQSPNDAAKSGLTWFPIDKGGPFRKWFGNNDFLVNWKNDGQEIRNSIINKYPYLKGNPDFVAKNPSKYFLPGITWGKVTMGSFSARYSPVGAIFSDAGMKAFQESEQGLLTIAGLFNSKITPFFLGALSETINYEQGNIARLPYRQVASNPVERLISLTKTDWDSFETSWDFTSQPLLNPDYRQTALKATYQKLRSHWREMTLEMQRLEQENNRIFIEAYGLQDELNEKVDLSEITLTCNPHYRYGNDKSEDELEALLLADTMRELVSYAVGCMFGRYALDKPGLILANQGETLADFVRKVASDQWPVASKEGESYEGEKLQGSDRVAESHGSCAVGLSGNQNISQGGIVRLNQPGTPGGRLDTIQHSGGSSASIVSGVQKLSVDSEGIIGGSGNATPDRNAAGLSESRTANTNHGNASGSQQNDSGLDGKTGHWPLDTSHLSFVPDEDNVIPMLDGDWFTDDIAERFRKFLRVAFGEEHYEENLRFIEAALGENGKARDIRDYFLKDFYTDHVKRYKKRPIYWLFSSAKGNFNALIYMHRYRPDTVSVVLNDYLREFRTKLTVHKNHLEAVSISASSSPAEKTKALKEIEKTTKMIAEMEEYEREVLYPLATEQVEIDLDDGVKVNYPKFGAALKKIPGLDAKED